MQSLVDALVAGGLGKVFSNKEPEGRWTVRGGILYPPHDVESSIARFLDVLDSLELEASQRSQGLDRAEVVALVEQVIEHYQDWPDSGDGVMPTAMTTSVGMSLDSVLNVSSVRKFSLRTENSTHMASSAPIRPT